MDTAVGEGVVKGDGMDVKAAVCDHFSPHASHLPDNSLLYLVLLWL